MVWVKSEYAGEFAVLSAWLSALVPWYLTYVPDGPSGSGAFYMRFVFLQFRYFPGISFSENLDDYTFTRPDTAREIGFDVFATAFDLWYLGLAVVALAVALSLAMYVRYDAVEDLLPIHPVRVMGGLLLLQGIVFGAASAVFIFEAPFDGQYPLPLGVVLVLVLGVSLLRVELIEDEGGDEAAHVSGSGEVATGEADRE